MRHAFTALKLAVALGAASSFAYAAAQALAPLAKIVAALAGVGMP